MEEIDKGSRWGSRRALSTPIAAVVMLIVIVVAGVGTYYGLEAAQPASKTLTSCEPASSAVCTGISNLPLHDVSVYAPFTVAYTGTPIAFTAQLPVGEVGTQYNFSFGDGTYLNSSASQATHTYSTGGNFIIVVKALVSGQWHDNYRGGLLNMHVTPSAASATSGNSPAVVGQILSNSTSTQSPTAIFNSAGGTIAVLGTYTGAPTNPVYVIQPPKIVASKGVTLTPGTPTSASLGANASVSAPGIYTVTFVGSAADGSTVAYQNFTWTIVAGPSGINSGTPPTTAAKSGHTGTLIVYELAPGGSTSEDPAIDYETVGFEPILNVYQTLISYNGSQTGPSSSSYFPEIATCVPGSAQCQALYGNNLSDGTNFTFVISSAPQFYDSGTGNHWGVYPTDVVFSLARTMGFSMLPCWTCNNGWIVTQSLLSPGSSSWDGGIHANANNTPQNIMSSMIINGTDCPSIAMSQQHGCVTFVANGSGHIWPYFLELITDPLGASIVPCGWFSAPAQGAGIPYWTAGNVTGYGDHPCAAMGSSAAWGQAPNTIPATAWDSWEKAGSGYYGTYLGNVQWNMVGSGPYYLKNLEIGSSYTLAANPDYQNNPTCALAACQPKPGQYAGTVSVTWETTETPGEQSYQAGIADFASIPPTQAGFAIQLSQQGKIGITSSPSLSIFFFPFNLAYNTSTVSQWATSPVNIPSDFFSYNGMREFFVTAYPYQSIQQTISTKDGIQYLFNYGGVIPQFMANYYPTNISWPSGDPSTNCATGSSTANGPLCATWWWNQITSSSSIYYDPEVAACTTSNPCKIVTFGQLGSPDLDQRFALWNSELSSLSGGRIQVVTTDLTFTHLVILSLFSGPYGNPMPLYNLGWAPDYPDPTDYVNPMLMPDATYTASDSVLEQLTLPTFDAAGCPSDTNYAYWAAHNVSTTCQGSAYQSMVLAMQIAATTPPGPQRVLLYNMAENIANKLALYGYYGQSNVVTTYASWINPTTLNNNPTIGGGGDNTWFTVNGNGVW